MESKNTSAIDCLLSKNQLRQIVTDSLLDRGVDKPWTLVDWELKTACDGLRGFLGDHTNLSVKVTVGDELVIIKLFLKSLPANNKPKAKMIEEFHFYKKEMLMYRIFDEIGGCEGPSPWRPKVYLCDENIIVMPDLSDDYTQRSHKLPLDLDHVNATAASLARFHAAIYHLETTRGLSQKHPYTIIQGHEEVFQQCSFKDTPWMRSCAKLSANFLKTFSKKYVSFEPDLEQTLTNLFLQTCCSMKIYNNTINVLLHKDLWVNNVMFKYDGAKINALLIDFQCVRYGPPAFDLMTFLYLTTSREFRRCYEEQIIRHYYTTFMDNLHGCSKDKADSLGYSYANFRDWCETARMFGVLEAICIFPFVLMDPKSAKKTYDNPDTFEHHINVDRSEPCLCYAKTCTIFKERNVEVLEEFYERYILKK